MSGEDTDLGPLFSTPQITTTDDGRHFDQAGQEYEVVEADGELDFRPTGRGQVAREGDLATEAETPAKGSLGTMVARPGVSAGSSS